ncbi:MAG: hypothetical protein WC004_00250 [Candidatus Absconditabacterales bacterium]
MKYVSSFRLSRYHICVTVVGIFLCATIHNTYTYANNDLLNQAFDESKRYDTVINPGNDKGAVGGQVFTKTLEVNIGGGGTERKEPYLVRFTKLILRVTIALAVPIIIRAGIMYATAFGDPGKQKKARSTAIYALLGILLALSSLAIIQLVLSVTRSSIEF